MHQLSDLRVGKEKISTMALNRFCILLSLSGLLLMLSMPTEATTRLTMKSGKVSTSYYVMMVQLAEMIKTASNGKIIPTVEESQGSVQNIKESFARSGNFLFTTPPSLLAAARNQQAPFDKRRGNNARALFVMPYVTVHFVVAKKSSIHNLEALSGQSLIPGGKGTFCEQRAKEILSALDLDNRVKSISVEVAAAAPALRNNRVDGFINCSSHPTPQISELASIMPIRLLSLTQEQQKKILALDPLSDPVTIPAGTYKGQTQDVFTVGTPVGAFATDAMDDETAYFITRTFWEWKDRLAAEKPWWQGVTPDLIEQMGTTLHPGALKYYEEVGVKVPAGMR